MSTCERLQEARAHRDLGNNMLLTQVEALVTPLRRLDERTRASILVLVGVAELITANQRSLAATDEGLGAEFARSLQVLHSQGARVLTALDTDGERASPPDSPMDRLIDVLRGLKLAGPLRIQPEVSA
jgi:hypothetical protein